jgi:hypothetical protein
VGTEVLYIEEMEVKEKLPYGNRMKEVFLHRKVKAEIVFKTSFCW